MNPTFNTIIQLANVSFGTGYLTEDLLNKYDSNSESEIILEFLNKELIGFSIIQLLDIEQLKMELFTESVWVENEFGMYERIGYRKMTAVSEEHQGKGIASTLYKKADNWFKGKTGVVVSALWTQKGNPSFSPILLKNGFKPIKTIEKYWEEDSINRGFICPICSAPPCVCDAVLYKKLIE